MSMQPTRPGQDGASPLICVLTDLSRFSDTTAGRRMTIDGEAKETGVFVLLAR